MITDFFRGEVVDKINLAGLDHVVFLSAGPDNIIRFRHYFIRFKKSGTKVPNVDLEEIGPSLDLTVRRTRLASEDLRKESLKTPKGITPTKQKNIKTNTMKETLGTLHVGKQKFEKLTTKHTKGLKRSRAPSAGSDGGLEDSEGGSIAAPSASKVSKRSD
jgi:ribosome production factor 2